MLRAVSLGRSLFCCGPWRGGERGAAAGHAGPGTALPSAASVGGWWGSDRFGDETYIKKAANPHLSLEIFLALCVTDFSVDIERCLHVLTPRRLMPDRKCRLRDCKSSGIGGGTAPNVTEPAWKGLLPPCSSLQFAAEPRCFAASHTRRISARPRGVAGL